MKIIVCILVFFAGVGSDSLKKELDRCYGTGYAQGQNEAVMLGCIGKMTEKLQKNPQDTAVIQETESHYGRYIDVAVQDRPGKTIGPMIEMMKKYYVIAIKHYGWDNIGRWDTGTPVSEIDTFMEAFIPIEERWRFVGWMIGEMRNMGLKEAANEYMVQFKVQYSSGCIKRRDYKQGEGFCRVARNYEDANLLKSFGNLYEQLKTRHGYSNALELFNHHRVFDDASGKLLPEKLDSLKNEIAGSKKEKATH